MSACVSCIVRPESAQPPEITAEGMEDSDQLSRLRGQGCGNIHGYFFSRPVEGDAVGTLLRRRFGQAA